ncbi:hypothetical protein LCGC14_1285090, partial [marine sediment metagenome]
MKFTRKFFESVYYMKFNWISLLIETLNTIQTIIRISSNDMKSS